MNAGDLIKLPPGTVRHWGLKTDLGVLIAKLPRMDELEYDWKVFVDGRYLELGRQIERSAEVINASR